jgi:hypothetical protein
MGDFSFLEDDPNRTVVMPRARRRPQKKTTEWQPLATAFAVVSVISIVGALAVLGVMGLARGPGRSVLGSAYASPSDMAVEDAREHIRNQLLSPRSAIFPSECEVKKINDRFFLVASYVDAHNAFGTHVRQQWRTRVRYEQDGSVSFSDTVIY